MHYFRLKKFVGLLVLGAMTATLITACGDTQTVVERVVETVVVEKEVGVKGDTVLQTVVVEKMIKGDTVVQTVVVEKEVKVKGDTVVQTVVSKPVEVEVVKEVAVDGRTSALLTVGAGASDLAHLDAQITSGGAERTMADQVLEFLYNWDADFTLQASLAESFSVSSDGLTWTFKLRPNLKYHNGDPVTMHDVAGSMKRVQASAPLIKSVWGSFGPEAFDDWIKVKDDLTLEMHLTEATGLGLQPFGRQLFGAYVVPEATWSTPFEEAVKDPIGTGPYEFDSWTPGDRYSLTRFEGYQPSPNRYSGYSGKKVAHFDRVEVVQVPDPSTMIASLKTGVLDIGGEVSAETLGQVTGDRDIQLYEGNVSALVGIMNNKVGTMSDVRVRQAFHMAFDNESVLRSAFGDEQFWNFCGSFMQCGSKYADSEASLDTYNTKRVDDAKKIIEDLGLAGTEVTVLNPSERYHYSASALVARETFEDIGFTVNMVTTDWPTVKTLRQDPTKWDYFTTGHADPRRGMYGPVSSSFLQIDGWYNFYQDESGKMGELVKELARVTTEEDAIPVIKKINAFFYEELPYMHIGEWKEVLAARSVVKGLKEDSKKPWGKGAFYNIWIEE